MKGWSTEEMKDKPNSLLEEDTEEMREWRHMSQEEMDECWKKLAGRGSGQVQGRGQQKRDSQMQILFIGMETCTKKQEVQDTKVERRFLGKNLRLVQRIQSAASAKHA